MNPFPVGQFCNVLVSSALAVAAQLVTSISLQGMAPADPQSPRPPKTVDHLVLMVDQSISMGQPPSDSKGSGRWLSTKMSDVVEQLTTLVNNVNEGTQLRVYAFDEKLFEGPNLTIGPPENTKALHAYIQSLKPLGKATHLWRSLERVLAEVKPISQQPGQVIRILVFTDGEDNDPDQELRATVLRKYSDVLKSQVQLTYVTLGFELRTEAVKELEAANVRVQAALTPDEIIPLSPEFQLYPDAPIVGEEVRALDGSLGVVSRYYFDWNDGSPYSEVRSPSHTYTRPGEYLVRLAIHSRSGKHAIATKKIVVRAPSPPQAAFELATDMFTVGDMLIPIEHSNGQITERRWSLTGGGTWTDRAPRIRLEQVGSFQLELHVRGPHGESKTARSVTVCPVSAPMASFTFGSDRPYLGDTLRITDTTSGKVDRVEFRISERSEPFVLEYGGESNTPRFISISLDTAGPIEVQQISSGPGGTSHSKQILTVLRRDQAPQAALVTKYRPTRGPTEVEFENRSKGTVLRSKYEFSDGSPAVELDGIQNVTHRFEPGKHQVKLIAYGPNDLPASAFEIEIEVLKPISAWVWYAIWSIPLMSIIGYFGARLWSSSEDARYQREQLLLRGELCCYDAYDSRELIATEFLDGTSSSHEFEVAGTERYRLQSAIDQESGEVQYHLSSIVGGMAVQTEAIDGDRRVQVGNRLFRLNS